MRTALSIALALLFGCMRTPPEARPEPPMTPAPRAVRTASSAAELVEVLQEQLGAEARRRPAGTPTVEAVMKALAAGGVPVDTGRQSLALLIAADYCWQSRSSDGLIAFSVCEYPSAEAVVKSQQASLSKFPGMGERTFLVTGHTMVTIKVHQPGGEALIEKVRTILAGLK